MQIVDVITGVAIAIKHALDRNLGKLRPLPDGTSERIIEEHFDTGATDFLALARAFEDHILYRFATQLRGFRFAEHPTHGINDVGFATSVGADDTGQLAGENHYSRIDE